MSALMMTLANVLSLSSSSSLSSPSSKVDRKKCRKRNLVPAHVGFQQMAIYITTYRQIFINSLLFSFSLSLSLSLSFYSPCWFPANGHLHYHLQANLHRFTFTFMMTFFTLCHSPFWHFLFSATFVRYYNQKQFPLSNHCFLLRWAWLQERTYICLEWIHYLIFTFKSIFKCIHFSSLAYLTYSFCSLGMDVATRAFYLALYCDIIICIISPAIVMSSSAGKHNVEQPQA